MAGKLVFIGGGNMASAILGGLMESGHAAAGVVVVEPAAAQAHELRTRFGVQVDGAAGPAIAGAAMVVWAVKPQVFPQAAAPCAAHVAGVLQVSIMAGVRSDAIAAATGSERVVRAMPNTPALIGQGIAGLFARAAATAADRDAAQALLAPTGQTLWVGNEADLDAITAVSGSGPAYVFYFIEALMEAATRMGFDPSTARRLALATFRGATALAESSDDAPSTLRERVTSKGGTTQAAIAALEAHGVGPAIVEAVEAARRRAEELGR